MLTGMLVLAGAGFFCLFSPWTQQIPFWPVMTIMAVVLSAGSLMIDRRQRSTIYHFKYSDILIGISSMIFLYLVFWIGHWISTHILPFAAVQIDSIYAIKEGHSRWLIAGLLMFIIGPAEEIFWRGFVQRRLSNKYSLLAGFLVATALYTVVHVWSFNLMLIAASALCGAFWGLLFVATSRLWPCIISHALWDIVIFILLPIQ